MNILLTDMPAAVTEMRTPPSSGMGADSNASESQGEGEFSLLLHREISAEPESLAQGTEFSEVSMDLSDAYPGLDMIAGMGMPESVLAPATGIGIDRQLFASNPVIVNEVGLAVPAVTGVTLPVGGNSLPLPFEAPLNLGSATPQSDLILPGVAGQTPELAVSAAFQMATGGLARADSGRPNLPPTAVGANAPEIDAAVTAVDSLRMPSSQVPAEGRVEAAPTLPVIDDMPSMTRPQFAALDVAVARLPEVGPAGVLPTDLRPAPAGAELLSLSPNAGARQWGEALGERVHWMINREQSAATLRLDPPNLGKLDVQLRFSDDATTITIQAQHAQARDMIEAAAPRLREMLMENGFQNVNVDVSQQQQQSASDGQLSGEASADEAKTETTGDAADSNPASGQPRRGNRLLDTFA